MSTDHEAQLAQLKTQCESPMVHAFTCQGPGNVCVFGLFATSLPPLFMDPFSRTHRRAYGQSHFNK
jgi:hypothetical protein